MTDPLKLAIAGLGTVGVGTLELLAKQDGLLTERCGRPLRVTAVSARDRARDRGVDLSSFQWFDDAAEMAAKADADVVVELIGGSDGKAKEATEAAIAAGRHVVTANKALIALHGTALAGAAEDAGVTLAYEAAVAGAIPIIRAMREGLSGNRISRLRVSTSMGSIPPSSWQFWPVLRSAPRWISTACMSKAFAILPPKI
jgi:homoserine dehydrogenase